MRNKKWQWELKRQWEFLGGFYEENGIEQLYDIDDAEY